MNDVYMNAIEAKASQTMPYTAWHKNNKRVQAACSQERNHNPEGQIDTYLQMRIVSQNMYPLRMT